MLDIEYSICYTVFTIMIEYKRKEDRIMATLLAILKASLWAVAVSGIGRLFL